MPKLKPSPSAEKDLAFEIIVVTCLTRKKMKKKELATLIGVQPNTITNWLKNPTLLLKIVRRVFDALDFTDEEKLKVL